MTGNLDAVVDAVMGVEAANRSATHVIASPSAWTAIATMKTGTGSEQSLIGAGVEAAQRQLLGMPVLVSAAVPADAMSVVDRSAILSVYGQVMVATSEDFCLNRDSIGVRVTFRFGAALVDPARIVSVTVGA